MSTITLHNESSTEATVLSNTFIDYYMPEANGEFVKVYIYLLRTLSNAPVSFSIEELADQLICTERDVLRALTYWEKAGLLLLETSDDRKICGITLKTPPIPSSNHKRASEAAAEKETKELSSALEAASNPDSSCHISLEETSKEAASQEEKPVKETALPPLTADRVKELKENEEVHTLLFLAEQYLAKTLTPTETQKLLFFYDGLHFPVELIEYLIEYCVERSHKSIRYIETVAMAWARDGILTVDAAKAASSRHHKDYFTILKALGISGRNPVDTEIALMDKWMKDYGFSMELIQEACSRTVLQTGQPSLPYADKILSGWKKKNVHTLADIEPLDAEHQKRKAERIPRRPSTTASNRFNNFPQREYDYDELEKRLLNR